MKKHSETELRAIIIHAEREKARYGAAIDAVMELVDAPTQGVLDAISLDYQIWHEDGGGSVLGTYPARYVAVFAEWQRPDSGHEVPRNKWNPVLSELYDLAAGGLCRVTDLDPETGDSPRTKAARKVLNKRTKG